MTDHADIARETINRVHQEIPEDATTRVRLSDDEYENWHIEENTDHADVELSLRLIAGYRVAIRVWDMAQDQLKAAVEAIEETFPEEARDHGWVGEWLRGDISRPQLNARIAGCDHPTETIRTFEATGSRRCGACAIWITQ